MGKNKGTKGKASATPVVATPAKSLTAVKDGRVTKPAQSVKSKAKELAKAVVTKSSKKAKEPTPSSESESESEASSAGSDEESEVEEAKAPETKVNGAKRIDGVGKAEDSDSSDSDSSESESEDEVHVPAPKENGVKVTAATNGADLSGSDDEESEDSEDSSESDEEAPTKAKVVTKKAEESNGSDDSDDSDGSDGSEDSEDGSEDDSEDSDASEESVAEVKQNKRKAEEDTPFTFKKAKTTDAEVGKNGESKNLFVGNLSFGIDEDGLYAEFKEFGEVVGCRVVYDRDSGRSKGFGYVEFASIEEAIAAHGAKNGALLDGRALNVDYSQPRTQTPRDKNVNGFSNDRAKRFGDTQSPASDTVFVGNISFDATNELIQEAFQSFGTITRVSLPTDMETGALKGFGYVGFSSVDEAKAAVESLNGTDIAGRSIRLDFAQPRPDRDGGGGGRGRGRGGPRGGGGFRGRGGGDRGGRGGGRGGGGFRGGRGASTNRGGFGDFQGKKMTF